MNFSSALGTALVGAVIFFGVIQNSLNPSLFLDPKALILVLGRTVGLSLMAFPFSRLKEVFDFLVYGMFLKKRTDDIKNVVDIIRIAHFYQVNSRMFLQHLQINYIFLKEAAVLLSQERLSVEEISLILQNRKTSFQKKYAEENKMLLAMAKFPPGLGILGTTSGLIEALYKLNVTGTSSGFSWSLIAGSLISFFWGMALANFVFLPLADYSDRISQEDLFSRELAIHGIIMIKQGYPVASVSEAMISELPITDQMMLRSLIFKNQEAEEPDEEVSVAMVNLDFLDQTQNDITSQK
ncbi:MAG: MotA/TolQ/ExbB proton channel family protein [Bdellovibrionales bacterium]|nr:MotA/TolQ/ExbB proton channel family protein [Bdellovibrionales bacterium]